MERADVTNADPHYSASSRNGGLHEAITKRIVALRKSLKVCKTATLRCSACWLVRDAMPKGFICDVGVCPKKFELITVLNGRPVVEAT
jgi:hypothetical protein